MKLIHLPLIAVVVGILLIVLSYLWPSIFGKAGWSEEQAQERRKAASTVHGLIHERAHAADHDTGSDPDRETATFEAAKERYQRAETEFQRARSLPLKTATVLNWTGIVFSLAGGVGYFLARRSAAG